jgi:hypothetical protein
LLIFRLALDAGHGGGNALGCFGDEVAEVAHDGRQAERDEPSEGDDGNDQDDDHSHAVRRAVAAQVERRDAAHQRHQDDGEERADVDDFELAGDFVTEREQKKDADGEEHVAANRDGALLGDGLVEVRRRGERGVGLG